jgi:transposase
MTRGHTALQVFDLSEPQPLIVTEYRAHAFLCRKHSTQTRTDFPAEMSAPVQYGARLTAVVVYLLHYQLLPENRLDVLMAHLFGVPLVTATTASMSRPCAARCHGFGAAVRDHMDETGLWIGEKMQRLQIASMVWRRFYRVSLKRAACWTTSWDRRRYKPGRVVTL